jgi:quercetin dioxygenase-like cupin family protein
MNVQPCELSQAIQNSFELSTDMSVKTVEIKKGAVTQPHKHTKEELVIVLKGTWRFTLPTHDVIVGQNQMLLIPAQLEHSSEALEDTIAIDVCTPAGSESKESEALESDPDQYLWAVSEESDAFDSDPDQYLWAV